MSDYYFNLPPLHALTDDQRRAVDEPNPLALSGGPGTGKTTVSIYRHLRRHRDGSNCQLLTFTRSLALYLRKCCDSESLDFDKSLHRRARRNITSIYQWLRNPCCRDEVIVDEAQDVKGWRSMYNGNINIYKSFKERYSNVSFGCDDNQKLYDNGITYQELISIFDQNKEFRLEKSFRGTKAILLLARELFSEANISDEMIDGCQDTNLPRLYITDKKEEKILEVLNNFAVDGHNIAILCAQKDEVDLWFSKVHNHYPDCTCYCNRDNLGKRCSINRISNIHVTTFKSAKGLEFDTVIIPNFERVENLNGSIITWHDYYVGITRAKRNLYLLSNKDIIEINGLVEKYNI